MVECSKHEMAFKIDLELSPGDRAAAGNYLPLDQQRGDAAP
jgi:hypothetical protein